ncbi:MAG: type II secretion system protein [Candidatus Omnitrophica bacterium]|nr:type II secretion system protein [Candidatus Omnitrophota bacterium]
MKPLKIKKGFTLVEMMMVACIFSIIAAAIGASLASGLSLWGRFKGGDAKMEALIGFEKIAKDLRQSLNLPDIGFEGGPSEVSFPLLEGNMIAKITYRFDPEKKTVFRERVYLKDIMSPEAKEELERTEKEFFYPEEFSLEYLSYVLVAKSYTWQKKWTKAEGIFSAVRIKAKFGNEELEKTVLIPVS